MSRLGETFTALHSARRAALIPYLTAGDPNPDATVSLMRAMVDAGADAVELGVPFSDPMADGPVIQRASERALRHGVTLDDVLDMVRSFRQHCAQVPVVLMGYLNPFEVMGYATFARRAADAGVDGVITVDMPPEEGVPFSEALRESGIDTVYLVAPTSAPQRVKLICESASGFIYYVSLRGVTGASHVNVTEVAQRIEGIKNQTDLPVGVGFGIDGPEIAAQMAKFADAIIVGSAIIRRIEEGKGDLPKIKESLTRFVRSMSDAIAERPQRVAANP